MIQIRKSFFSILNYREDSLDNLISMEKMETLGVSVEHTLSWIKNGKKYAVGNSYMVSTDSSFYHNVPLTPLILHFIYFSRY